VRANRRAIVRAAATCVEALEDRRLFNADFDTFRVGSIPTTFHAGTAPIIFDVDPPQGVNSAVAVTLTTRGYGTPLISTDGNGVQTYNYSLPVVGSSLSFKFNPASGVFEYTRDSDDRFDFTLEFSVPGLNSAGLPIAQQVKVVPKTLAAVLDRVLALPSRPQVIVVDDEWYSGQV